MEYFAAIKRNDVPTRATAWMDFENIMQSERHQKQKTAACYMIPCV